MDAGPAAASPTVDVAEREIARRNQLAVEASELIQQGNRARESRDLALAVDAYGRAYQLLPNAPAYTALRRQALSAYSESSVAHAEELATQGRYAEANGAIDAVLVVSVNPDYRPALRLKERLQDAERYHPALTPDHVARVQKVSRLLTLANGHFDLGEYDKAVAAYNEVITLDAYNTAARRGLERTERTKSEYHKSARDHTRADAIRQVDGAWAEQVPQKGLVGLFGPSAAQGGESLSAGVSARFKMNSIIFPQVQLLDATLEEVVQFLVMQSKTYDVAEPDPGRKGINLVLGTEPGLSNKRVSLSLTNVPLSYVLDTVARQAGTRVRVEDSVITLGSGTAANLITRSYRVPPGFFEQAPSTAAPGADPFSSEKPADTGLAFRRISAAEFLRQNGITDVASAYFNAATSLLTVRTSPANHDVVQALVDQASTGVQRLVRLKVTMLEVDQDNLKELGYDWLLAPFDVSRRVFGVGGTAGNTATGDETAFAQNFPFIPPTAGGGTPVGQNPVTAGNRSGNAALETNSIDSLIANTLRTPSTGVKAPAVFGISGVFTDPQFQVVLRGLNQKKGVDVMSSPTVVAKSGQRAKVQVVREFPYPTEFEPPEIPQDFGSNQTSVLFFDPAFGFLGGAGGTSDTFPVTPTTPTAFEFKNVGHELEVEATVGPDNQTIELDLAPAFREFEGMVEYGTPIITYPDGQTPSVLTENHIPQPVFRTNRTEGIRVSLWSGNTMVIAGLATEEHISVEDKTPILGDLPLIGRFFRTQASRVKRKAVVFMVTAEIITPSGESPTLLTPGTPGENLTWAPPAAR
ncbi:MAG: Amuc_1098 family type IV pilus outer membrane protein [Verrucomicrobiales bacterium]